PKPSCLVEDPDPVSNSPLCVQPAASTADQLNIAPAGRGWLRKIYTPIIFHHLYGQPADLRSGEDAFYVHIRPLALGRSQLSLSGSGQNRLYQDRLFLEPGAVCFDGMPSRQ